MARGDDFSFASATAPAAVAGLTHVAQAGTWAMTAEQVENWVIRAKPGERTVYARGAVLPRGAGVSAMRSLHEEAEVILNLRRIGPDLFEYLATRRAVARSPMGGRGVGTNQVDGAGKRLLDVLIRLAERHEACPGNLRLARLAGFDTPQKAAYYLNKLIKLGVVRTETNVLGYRVVTICRSGKRTAPHDVGQS